MTTITGTSGNNTLNGGDENDVISGLSGRDTLYGGAGNDVLDGGTGNDQLYGGAGDDTLIGGAGADRLFGGDGIDTADYSSSGAGVNVNLSTGRGSGGDAASDTLSGVENVIGSDFADTLTGDAADNFLSGGTGNDALYGGVGDDTLRGGSGADTLTGAEGLDLADYTDSDAGVSINLSNMTASGGHAAGDVLSGVDGVIGSAFDDTLIGFDQMGSGSDAYTNLFYGGGGNDYIDAKDGNDSLYGGTGNDTLIAGAGDDTAEGGEGNDSIDGGAGNDWLAGGDGRDTIYGGAGNDILFGETGEDLLFGGEGHDQLFGGAGDDTLDGGAGNDLIYGGAGNDSIDGGAGDDKILAEDGEDWISGGEGRDLIYAGAGSDTIYGGAGADTIYADEGDDIIIGGEGADLIYAGAGDDSITAGAGDTIYGGEGDNLYTGSGAAAIYGGGGTDTFLGAPGGYIDGGESKTEWDVLDLSGLGPLKVAYDPTNPENGTVTFYDDKGQISGSMTFRNIEKVIPCFTRGTRILCERGERRVENLRAGDRVMTRDHGLQELRWVGRKQLGLAEMQADPRLHPILIRAGALGQGLPERDMKVSRQHRMLICDPRAALMFGSEEVLVQAEHLLHLPGVVDLAAEEICYIHLLFDRHEVVLSDGAWSESFQPGERTLAGMGEATREEVLRLFPELAEQRHYPAARPTLKSFEAKLLLVAEAAPAH
ncbi:Hint domain-containing protein [Xinfangfangia sp. CPCC 101601]|uniref:Hint domain-containing protein n=1 Tax=Pseudogemmobacter lacusdianii TaxID=3069608 RepID=A0ABU0VYS8_9RHOB|nr:Hint domain-containing protein [Xinfangfangia sp. CPCC 101601]MDQ2066887.1 Hint domain-containing protein [Xinfangfangia sp. CPCC 101601]